MVCATSGSTRRIGLERVVAVGTGLCFVGSARPPRRSQRELLAHWALGLDTSVESRVRPGVDDPDRREPPLREAGHALPGEAAALAATPERPVPVLDHHVPGAVGRLAVAGHGLVGGM